MKYNRRNFFKQLGLVSSLPLIAAANDVMLLESEAPDLKRKQPLWKGFNLLNKFNPDYQTPFQEKDFEIMAEWGFNFVRLPLSYWCWSREDNWYSVNENVLKEIDRAVEFAKQYKMHVNLNFHRVPGYCINEPKPSTNLFEDEEPLKACEFHWKLFAERYKNYSSRNVSFNLINEAPSIEDAKYDKVARRLIGSIRQVDPDRLIIVDGKNVGCAPLMTLTDVPNILQSGRGYMPMLVSHYAASWVYGNEMKYPLEKLSWPLIDWDGTAFDKDRLRKELNQPWASWVKQGGKVHIGEFGCHNRTPHTVALDWLTDLLDVFKENNWGWSLWNLHGSFGVLDSERTDVKYENYKGHKLDRKMLELLLRS